MKDEWWNSSTSKPSKLVTVTGCRESMVKWHHDMPQHLAILRSPSHTPGLGPLGTNLAVKQIDVLDGRVCLQRLGQGLETETDQGWRLHPGLYRSNRDHWNPENTWHLALTCESLWYRTLQTMQKATVAYSIYIFDNSPCDERWMMKLQHLQTVQTCHCHRMPGKYGKVTSWHAAAFSDSAEPIPHTRPWRPRHQCRSMTNRCSWRTRLSSAPRPRPGNGDRARLASSSRALPFKSWSLKSGEHMTFNSDMRISLIENLANNDQKATVAYSIYIFDNSPCDERWMMKLQHLQTIQTCHCQRMSKTHENRSIQRWALPSKPDHWNPENIWEQIYANMKKHLTQTCESLWCET